MPNLKQMFEFLTSDPLAWAAFAAIPVILFCIACLMPRGNGRVLVNIERAVIIIGVVAVLVAPFIIDKVNPDLLKFDPYREIIEHGTILTTAIVALAVSLVWGIFTGRSYITQAIYGMLACVCLPFGLINLVFPTWATATNIVDVAKTPVDLLHLLLYSACFFIPVWLIRSGEYKLRISSVWHLISGLTVGGCAVTFAIETNFLGANSQTFNNLLHILDNVESFESLKDINYSFMIKVAYMFGIFLAIIVVAGLLVSFARVILKTGDRVFVSESIGGLFFRTVGNILSNLICGVSILLVPQLLNHASTYPMALVYLVPILLYFIINLVCAFLADTVEIKRGIARANRELAMQAQAEVATTVA